MKVQQRSACWRVKGEDQAVLRAFTERTPQKLDAFIEELKEATSDLQHIPLDGSEPPDV
jgi:hypothetical protein